MSSFEGRVFLCSNCGREIDWYEICECQKEEESE